MASIREQLAAEADIGGVTFWATSASGPGAPRSIVQHGGIGVTGAVTVDLGRPARTETLKATVDETVFLKLIAVKDAAKVVDITHPLFGTFQGRVQDVPYEAGPDDMVDITVTVIEHGEPSILLAPAVVTLSSAAADADAAFANLGDDLDGLGDFPLTDDLTNNITNINSSYSTFSGALDDAQQGVASFEDIAAEFTAFAQAGQALVDSVDTAWDTVTELADFSVQDLVYETIDAARDCVNSMERQLGNVWEEFQVRGSVSIAELAREFIGADDDDSIQLILDRNPQIVDVSAILPGVSVSIPIL